MIKELISTATKPGVKPVAATAPASEPVKTASASPAKEVPVAAAPATPPPPVKAVDKAAEPVETAKTPEVKAPAAATAAESELSKAVQGWASAWSRKDVKSYLGYYAADFRTPNGMARKAWEAERTQRIDRPGKLQVSIDELKISLDGDKATVKFRQHYVSATLKSSTNKTMVFVKSGSKWLISQERVG